MSKSEWWERWSPENVTLADDVPGEAWKVCVIHGVYFGEGGYNGKLGVRISSVFVIFITSLAMTLVPLLARKWHVPEVYYMIAKMFGSGVIVATAFVHLMDPAYNAIGPTSCVGMTGAWADYSWCATFIMCGALLTFLIDSYCGFFVDRKYSSAPRAESRPQRPGHDALITSVSPKSEQESAEAEHDGTDLHNEKSDDELVFRSQFYGFLILECGILLHSVMIGLSLGTTADLEALYAAIAFHQAFEGLGIGARLSAIPFRPQLQWVPYALCVAYALTTPVAIAVGIGVRSKYRENGYTSLVVGGILDSFAAGVLIYTGFVELIARDFIFATVKPQLWEFNLQIGCFMVGAAVMAVIGKWA